MVTCVARALARASFRLGPVIGGVAIAFVAEGARWHP